MDTNLLKSVLLRISTSFTENLPSIITVILIILIGWIVSRLVAGFVKRVVTRTGLNKAFDHSGFAQELDKIQPGRTLADLASSVTFWLLWLYIIFASLTGSDLNLEATPFNAALSFLPHLFVAFMILVGGVLLAQFIGRWVQVGVAATGVEFHETLGKGTRLLLIVIVIITAIEELGIDLTPLTNALTNIITIFVAGLALAFGIGAREVVHNILAGYYAREHFELGDQVQIDNETGTLDAIGTVSAEITLPKGRIVIPNSDLTEKMVKIYTVD
ncbi:MAG: mechanosensitive ion channel [Anaerolineae bacterium]|nr:mechanosensitive ion channel [Anaerolineae bacterium]